MTPDVLIIGGGLAGLCCGRELARRHIPFQILEASDGVGGRVRTDLVDGFRLDRGMQNYLSSYPEGKRVLDYESLNLKPFVRALLVRFGGKFHRVADPRDEFTTAVASALSPVGTLTDKLAAAKLKGLAGTDPAGAKDEPTADLLTATGVGPTMFARLFRPFLGSVFLEPELATSARFFRFVFHLFGQGHASLPALGVQQIPEQIAAGLPAGSVRLNCPVAGVTDTTVSLASGEKLTAKAVVIATDGPAAVTLSGGAIPEVGSNGTTTLYYAADASPRAEPILMLDGDGTGPASAVTVLSEVSREYAPAGKHLVAASVIGLPTDDDGSLDQKVRGQLGGWFGAEAVGGWRLLRVYRIRHALPSQPMGALEPWERPVKLRDGLFVCGDHRDNASINGAMVSGRRAAETVAGDLANGAT
jgi:protoporphyrinogen oxidase